MTSIRFDDSQFPLVVTEWPEGDITDVELEQWIAKCVAGWSRGRQVALHLGMRATGLSSLQRKRMSEFAKTNEHKLAKVVVATAISVWLITYLHNQEARRPFTWLQMLLLTLWFLVTFGLLTFLVIPD